MSEFLKKRAALRSEHVDDEGNGLWLVRSELWIGERFGDVLQYFEGDLEIGGRGFGHFIGARPNDRERIGWMLQEALPQRVGQGVPVVVAVKGRVEGKSGANGFEEGVFVFDRFGQKENGVSLFFKFAPRGLCIEKWKSVYAGMDFAQVGALEEI